MDIFQDSFKSISIPDDNTCIWFISIARGEPFHIFGVCNAVNSVFMSLEGLDEITIRSFINQNSCTSSCNQLSPIFSECNTIDRLWLVLFVMDFISPDSDSPHDSLETTDTPTSEKPRSSF
eukprot:m.23061 g.23061  ORF g.23061 m.23061 type:complete len:121 (+) comp14047_c1_seq1:3553-3915(+)